MKGHIDVIKALVDDFGVDPNSRSEVFIIKAQRPAKHYYFCVLGSPASSANGPVWQQLEGS